MPKPKPITGPSPSEFNARITLERPEKTPDGAGGPITTWVVVATVSAIADEFQSEELAIAMQSTPLTIIKMKIRYRTDLKSNWRINYKGKYYNVMGLPVDIGGFHRWLFFRVRG